MPTIAETFIGELEQEAATTRRVLERVPSDKHDWKPHEKSFSLGELASHVARIPSTIGRMASTDSYDLSELKKTEAAQASELVATMDACVAEAKEILAKISDEQMMSMWRLTHEGQTAMEMPRVVLIRAVLLNHLYHHRGQLTVYLRLLDIPVPSVYGPSADENPFT